MSRQAAVLIALLAIALAALLISVGSLILLRRSSPREHADDSPGSPST